MDLWTVAQPSQQSCSQRLMSHVLFWKSKEQYILISPSARCPSWRWVALWCGTHRSEHFSHEKGVSVLPLPGQVLYLWFTSTGGRATYPSACTSAQASHTSAKKSQVLSVMGGLLPSGEPRGAGLLFLCHLVSAPLQPLLRVREYWACARRKGAQQVPLLVTSMKWKFLHCSFGFW